MTNFEKYKDEILKIAETNNSIAFENGKVISCRFASCKKCDFYDEDIPCSYNAMKWLYEEYKEFPILTKKEYEFCMALGEGWIARDANEKLRLFLGKPSRDVDFWDVDVLNSGFIDITCLEELDISFNFIKWEDEEPWNVEDLLNLRINEME